VVAAVPALAVGEPPSETRRIRLLRYSIDIACISPMWIAEELLRAEGFEDISYLPISPTELSTPWPDVVRIGTGGTDITITDIFTILPALDAGHQAVALAGIHSGCYELFGTKALRSVHDLKGKTIAVGNSGRRGFVSAMLAHVGLDPRKDVTFVESWEGVRLLAEGKVDATLGFPPEPQIMRDRRIGVSLVNTAIDRPWSQYFCCMAIGNRDFVAKNPVAYQTRVACVAQGGGSVRGRTRADCAHPRRARLLQGLRPFGAGPARSPIQTLARIRLGRQPALLRVALARGGPREVESAEAACPENRLAFH
jgi:hypothetical protein